VTVRRYIAEQAMPVRAEQERQAGEVGLQVGAAVGGVGEALQRGIKKVAVAAVEPVGEEAEQLGQFGGVPGIQADPGGRVRLGGHARQPRLGY
jgi:hypothetical protein